MKAGEGEFYAQPRMRLCANRPKKKKRKERSTKMHNYSRSRLNTKCIQGIGQQYEAFWFSGVWQISEARGRRGIKTFRKYGWNNLVTIVHFVNAGSMHFPYSNKS